MAKETQIKEQIKSLIRNVSSELFELEFDLYTVDDTDELAVLKLFKIISPLNIKALSIKDSLLDFNNLTR